MYEYFSQWSYMFQGNVMYEGINIGGIVSGIIFLPFILIGKLFSYIFTTTIYKKDRN